MEPCFQDAIRKCSEFGLFVGEGVNFLEPSFRLVLLDYDRSLRLAIVFIVGVHDIQELLNSMGIATAADYLGNTF